MAVARDSGICGICGHPGAITADHIIPAKEWPPGVPGLDDLDNLRAAHGSRGPAEHNPCYLCDPKGRYCNQSRGAGTKRPTHTQEQHSRPW